MTGDERSYLSIACDWGGGALFNEASHDRGLNEWAKAKEGWIHALAVLVPGVDLQPSPVESLVYRL